MSKLKRRKTLKRNEKERKEAKKRHRATKKEALKKPAQPKLVLSALEKNVQRWLLSGKGYKIPSVFLNDTEDIVIKLVNTTLVGPKKVYTVLKCVLVKHALKTGEKIYADFCGRSKTHTITTKLGYDLYDEMKEKMLESLAKFQNEGSGWQLHSIIGLYIVITKFNPLSGSGHSKLPPFIANKKAVINVKNEKCNNGDKHCECKKCEESKMCFKWTVTRALNPVDRDSERVTKELRKQAEKYDWSRITFPVKVKDISIWEKNNGKFINVFGYDEEVKKLYNIKMCDDCTSIIIGEGEEKCNEHDFINLFLHDDNHYCVVKNLSRLVSSQYSKHKEPKHFCLKCQNGFGTNEVLKTHQEVCLKHKTQTEIYPKPGDTTKFKNYERLHTAIRCIR